jgi:hypothetical protein
MTDGYRTHDFLPLEFTTTTVSLVMTPVWSGMSASGERFTFSYALIRAIAGATVMAGRNSAGVRSTLCWEGGSEAVMTGQSGPERPPLRRVDDLRRQREDTPATRP